MKHTVLVSGGAGFIGSHVTVELVNAGYEVIVADNFSNCDMTNYHGVCQILGKKIPLVKMDFCDTEAVRELFERNKIDAVIHFAAFKAVGESVAEPLKYYSNNLGSFINILPAPKDAMCCFHRLLQCMEKRTRSLLQKTLLVRAPHHLTATRSKSAKIY